MRNTDVVTDLVDSFNLFCIRNGREILLTIKRTLYTILQTKNLLFRYKHSINVNYKNDISQSSLHDNRFILIAVDIIAWVLLIM